MTNGDTELRNLKGHCSDKQPGLITIALHVEGATTASPTYSWSPMLGSTIRWQGPCLCSVMLIVMKSSEKCKALSRGWCLSWVVKEWQKWSDAVISFCCCLLKVYPQKDWFPLHFAFYSQNFPAKHVHVEFCDWLNILKVTPSCHFSYLSARRSRLKTFTLDENISSLPWWSGRLILPAPLFIMPSQADHCLPYWGPIAT